MRTLNTETLPTAGETKMAKLLIFLAAVGATFNRHLVDTAQVVSSQSSANIAFPYGVYESAGLLEIFHVLLPAAFLPDHSYSQPTFRVGIENGPGGARQRQTV